MPWLPLPFNHQTLTCCHKNWSTSTITKEHQGHMTLGQKFWRSVDDSPRWMLKMVFPVLLKWRNFRTLQGVCSGVIQPEVQRWIPKKPKLQLRFTVFDSNSSSSGEGYHRKGSCGPFLETAQKQVRRGLVCSPTKNIQPSTKQGQTKDGRKTWRWPELLLKRAVMWTRKKPGSRKTGSAWRKVAA